jgi:hypothetical protein
LKYDYNNPKIAKDKAIMITEAKIIWDRSGKSNFF